MEKIRAVGLSKKFGGTSLFNELNFSFHTGHIIGLTGNNGVGKTTLIKLLCGLIYPDYGMLFVNGVEAKSNRKKWMEDVGVVLEGSHTVYWRLSALQNIIYFSGLKGFFGSIAYTQAEKTLRFFELWNVKDKKVETFSFGMKQRLALACSISHSPSIVILDEPTSGLDAKSTEILESYICSLAKEDKTVILASHDQDMVSRISTRILRIENGILNEVSKNHLE